MEGSLGLMDVGEDISMELSTVTIAKPDAINFILGQTHFIKSVEDLHEALVSAVPGIKFGLAFCEASGACLVRWSGNDDAMIALATTNALALSAGHSFLIFLAEGFYPLNVLNAVREHDKAQLRLFVLTGQIDRYAHKE